MEKPTPELFRRIQVFEGNKDEYTIKPGEVKERDFHVTADPPYLMKYRFKEKWGIFQLYVVDNMLFPLTSESVLVRVVGPSMMRFYLDWTVEADSWFMAVDFSENPILMTKDRLDQYARWMMEGMKKEPMPPAEMTRQHQNTLMQMQRLWNVERRRKMITTRPKYFGRKR